MPRKRSTSNPQPVRKLDNSAQSNTVPLPDVLRQSIEQATRWGQVSNQATVSLLDAQAAWFKGVEGLMAQWMSPWFARNGRITPGSAQDLIEPPTEGDPFAPWLIAQRLWTESSKAWIDALWHDAQEQPATPPR